MADIEIKSNPNTHEESAFVSQIDEWQTEAETGLRQETEIEWRDQYLAYKGDQWDMSIAARRPDAKSKRLNSVNNYILPTIKNIHDSLTTSMPEVYYEGRENADDNTADKLNDLIPFIMYRNKFRKQWKDIVLQGLKYGPFIGYVIWDGEWMGGAGPKRWVGEIRIGNQKKDEIFFDPAITDLEERLQECTFVNRKIRKKLDWIAGRWERGKSVPDDMVDVGDSQNEVDEGSNPQQATVIECWHKSKPKFIPKYWKERFNELAAVYREQGLTYQAQDFADMAEGKVDGVHCCYTAGGVFLEYIPYIYNDGMYPFIFKVLYQDEYNPMGFGEEKNILMPQVLYNKADEVEIEAMIREGLGGMYYDKGSVDPRQLNNIIDKGSQASGWFEVNDVNRLSKREPTQTPQSLLLFKEAKKKQIDTTSQNTTILQGESPGANVPFASVSELGARADVRNKGKVEILEDFLEDMCQMVVSRIAQFYTEEREYLIRGNNSDAIKTSIYDAITQIVKTVDPQEQAQRLIQVVNVMKTMNPQNTQKMGTFSNRELIRSWERDAINRPSEMEQYVPEFDLKIKIMDERPTSRKYYEGMAMQMYGKALGPKAFWNTIVDGTFPPVDEILGELQEMAQASQSVEQQA